MRPFTRATTVATLVAAMLAPEIVEAQCAMCRSVLASPEGQRLVAGLRHGILFLLAAPFAVFGTIAYLAVREQRKRHAAGGAGPPAADRSA